MATSFHHVPFRRLLIAGTISSLAAIISGGLVSATDSGAACATWPLCAEALSAPLSAPVWLAVAHRALVLLSLALVLAGAVAAWQRRDADPWLRLPLLVAPALIVLLSALGGVMVQLQLYRLADVWHLGLALLVLACQVVPLAALLQPAAPAEVRVGARAARDSRQLRGMAWWAVGGVGVMVLAMSARALPALGVQAASGLPVDASGALAISGLLSGGTLWQIRRSRRGDLLLLGAAALVCVLIAVEGTTLLLPATQAGLSLGVGALLWGAAVALAVLVVRRPLPADLPARARPAPVAERAPSLLSDYISLTKPKVISLLLVTTLAAMFITEAGTPSLALIFWTMVGGYLAAGGAGAINCAVDEDIDINMGRTSRRPVPSGRISARNAMIFGLALSALSVVVMLAFTTPLAALFSTLGIVYYALFYTRWLKRSTWQNIVIGGGAGSLPPLVGWTAVTGSLSLAAVLLFVIVFYWTPPHFWALALVKQKDYARAGVPMLPVVAGEPETRWQIFVYSAMMVALSLLLTPLGAMGAIYLALAALLGAIFMRSAWDVWRRGDQAAIWGLYKYSLLYLALLFAAMVADRLLLG
ncbi:heme o synthase [Oscillochloris sp. ZM17-4]|uniref:heme o synthase n=1 Tax=Oscillochloris sp. ZM17-4 TaxID=2866714 RepID=UPI001C72AAB0|nr:heme o synthase [Oscillochloris sp. ZM17-4]MBX0330806.1 heme o synthase [Oscillochloris sp. ZM17-4]